MFYSFKVLHLLSILHNWLSSELEGADTERETRREGAIHFEHFIHFVFKAVVFNLFELRHTFFKDKIPRHKTIWKS